MGLNLMSRMLESKVHNKGSFQCQVELRNLTYNYRMGNPTVVTHPGGHGSAKCLDKYDCLHIIKGDCLHVLIRIKA